MMYILVYKNLNIISIIKPYIYRILVLILMDGIKEPTVYVFLDDKYKFPPWFEKWPNGVIVEPISLPHSDKYRFSYNNEYVGQDDNYRFYLSDVAISAKAKDDKFMMLMVIQPRSKKNTSEYLKQIFLMYETLCPIIQFPENYYDDI